MQFSFDGDALVFVEREHGGGETGGTELALARWPSEIRCIKVVVQPKEADSERVEVTRRLCRRDGPPPSVRVEYNRPERLAAPARRRSTPRTAGH